MKLACFLGSNGHRFDEKGTCRKPVVLKTLTGLAALMPLTALNAASEMTEEDIMGGIPVVMSATRLPQSVEEAPVSITVLDRQLIEASGAIEIPDLLRLVPGMQVGLTWRDHHTAFGYHGHFDGLSRRMQLLIDGRVALGSQIGIVDWDRLSITVEDIERIEVVRGPAGSAYGFNAFLGAINIVTRDIATSPKWRLAASYGSNNLRQYTLQHSYSSEKLDLQMALGYFETDSFSGVNDEVESNSLRIKGRYQLAENQSLDLQVGIAEGPSGRGGLIPLVDPVGEKEVADRYATLRWNYAVSPDNQWHLQLGHTYNRENDKMLVGQLSDFVMPLPPGYSDEPIYTGPYDFHSSRVDLELQQTLTLNSHSRFVWGGSYRQGEIKGYLVLPTDDYYEDRSGRVFGNWEYRVGDWLFNTGAMFEDGDLADSNLSFRTGANYQLSDNQTIRVSYAEGWRYPFLSEAYNEVGLKTSDGTTIEAFLGYQDVQSPEKVTTYELGYVGEWLNHSLKTEVKVFHEKLENEIMEVLNPGVPELVSILGPGAISRLNAGETKASGAEFNIDYTPWQGGRIWAAYSYASAEQESDPLAVREMQKYNATPRHTGSLSLSQQIGDDWQLSLNYYTLDKMAWQGFGADLDRYDRLDARLATEFEVAGSRAKIELIGQNIAGADYSEFQLQNRFGSRYFIRVTLELN